MANNQIRLRSLPGAPRDYDIELLGDETSKPFGIDRYEVRHGDSDPAMLTLSGDVKRTKKKHPRSIMFPRVIISRANKDTLEQLRDSRTELTIEPPWADATAGTVGTYLPLQETLSDMNYEDIRGSLTFTRKSGRFNPVNGEKVGFDKPLYQDSVFGKGVYVSDGVSLTDQATPTQHWMSFEDRQYLTADAADGTNVTNVTVPDTSRFWAGQAVLVSTDEETTNSLELAEIDAVTSATVLKLSTWTNGAASASLTNTANYTVAKRAYVTNVLVSDCEMTDSGTGSWADHNTPSVKAKSTARQETGTQCLRVFGDAANDGVKQVLTPATIPAGTDLVVWARVKALYGTVAMEVYDISGAGAELSETTSSTDWTWLRYCVEVNRGGAATDIDLRFYASGAAAEWLVDRVYIFENGQDNGGMEGTYDAEVPGDIAPGWNNLSGDAGDTYSKDVGDFHGGSAAQKIVVDAASEGIESTTAPMVSGEWYLIGGYFKVALGTVELRERGFGSLGPSSEGIATASYTFFSILYQSSAGGDLQIRSRGSAATYLIDDVMVVRLPGNPRDNAIYDMPEQLSPTGYTIFGGYRPELASTSLDVDVPQFSISRHTVAAADKIEFYYDQSGSEFQVDVRETAAGVQSATASETFAADDKVLYALTVTGAGAIKIWAKVNTDNPSTGTGAAAGLARGMSRVWLRDPDNFNTINRGVMSPFMVVNEAMSDDNVEAILDAFANEDADRRALLDETEGIIWHVEDMAWEILEQSIDDKFVGSLVLTEADRVGSRSIQDA